MRAVKAVQVAVAAGGGIRLLEVATAGSTSPGVNAAAFLWLWTAAFAALFEKRQWFLSAAARNPLHASTSGCRRCVSVYFLFLGGQASTEHVLLVSRSYEASIGTPTSRMVWHGGTCVPMASGRGERARAFVASASELFTYLGGIGVPFRARTGC